jgi:hypothetical protein
MLEPRWESPRFTASFRSVQSLVERFPSGCAENTQPFDALAGMLEGLQYDGYIQSSRNSYQVNLTLDQCLLAKMRLADVECDDGPELLETSEITKAVGRFADLLLRVPQSPFKVVVEIEKANEEKVLRDIVKMLLFLEMGQADLAVMICPRNYAHAGGVWKVFDTAHQVLQSFVRVTRMPESQTRRLALIGCTQELFLNGDWVRWDRQTRSELQNRAKPYFEAPLGG